ncbi:MAG: cobalamin-dependent protein [Gammaproteobacteria bacterium]|nr:cobalamin-dependent protein [Gammaproteobacteria bacterium]
MKVLLINPPCGPRTIGLRHIARIEPLNLELLAAGLPGSVDVRIVDMEVAPGDLERMLAEFRPDIAGVTSEVVHVDTAKAALARVRAAAPGCLTVVGGHHPTLWPQDFLDPAIDLIVRGEGVATLREICMARAAGASEYSDIAGLMIREGEALVPTRPRPLPRTLDDQPMPDRALTTRYRDRYFYLWEQRVAAVRSSVGCSFPCVFCSCRVYTNGGFIARSPELLVEEIARLDEEFVYLCDDHAFHDPARMEELAERLLSAGVRKRYFTYARADAIAANPALFRLWARAGLSLVMTGLESLDYERLRRSGKRIEKGCNEAALAVLAETGIGMSAGFLVEPHFTARDFAAIDDYVRRHPAIVLTEFTPLTPFPGTPLYRKIQADILSADRQLYDLQHFLMPTKTPVKQLHRLMRRAYGQVILRAFFRARLWAGPMWRLHFLRLLGGLLRTFRALGRAHRDIRAHAPARG